MFYETQITRILLLPAVRQGFTLIFISDYPFNLCHQCSVSNNFH